MVIVSPDFAFDAQMSYSEIPHTNLAPARAATSPSPVASMKTLAYTALLPDFDSISGPEVAAILIIVLIVVLIALVFGFVFSAFISNPVIVGCSRFFTLSCMQDANVNEIGVAFKNGVYMNVVKTMFKMTIEIFLWSCLLFVPGFIKSYEYRMVRYIVAENPNISWEDAKQLSINMMEGNKMAAFVLDLSFLGWKILGAFTCGLLSIFWVNPYKCLTDAELYLTLRANMFVQQP
mgnify:CR=1 FL=1